MATRRVSKKKIIQESKVSQTESPVVAQVVEEVLDEKPEAVLEEIKEDAKNIEEAVEKLEDALPAEVPLPKDKPTEAPFVGKQYGEIESESVTEPEEVKTEQEVIRGLYKPKSVQIPSEVIADSRTSVKSILVWALVVIGIALLTGGILLLAAKGMQGLPAAAKPTPTIAPQPTPTPAAMKREDVKVQVLNGGGVSGSGSKMKVFLEEKGYTVNDVKNADAFTYGITEIHVKTGKEAYIELLKGDLADAYTVSTVDAGLSADSLYDAQVIVGKK